MKAVYRLKKNYQFRYVYKKGRNIANRLFIIHYAKNNNDRVQIGFSIPKKYGKAHERNKIKRQLRDVFTRFLPIINRKYNYIVIPKMTTKECDFQSLLINAEHLINKINQA